MGAEVGGVVPEVIIGADGLVATTLDDVVEVGC